MPGRLLWGLIFFLFGKVSRAAATKARANVVLKSVPGHASGCSEACLQDVVPTSHMLYVGLNEVAVAASTAVVKFRGPTRFRRTVHQPYN